MNTNIRLTAMPPRPRSASDGIRTRTRTCPRPSSTSPARCAFSSAGASPPSKSSSSICHQSQPRCQPPNILMKCRQKKRSPEYTLSFSYQYVLQYRFFSWLQRCCYGNDPIARVIYVTSRGDIDGGARGAVVNLFPVARHGNNCVLHNSIHCPRPGVPKYPAQLFAPMPHLPDNFIIFASQINNIQAKQYP